LRGQVAGEELALYEGVRLGSERAFRRLVAVHHGALLRVAGLYRPDPDERRQLVGWAWGTALHGLGMFTWQTSLRAWLFGILITHGRTGAVAVPAPPAPAPPEPRTAPPGPEPDWSALAWSPSWSPAAWAAVEGALGALPLPQREVVTLVDLEGWPLRDAHDALGLTAAEGTRLLAGGHEALRQALRRWFGLADAPDPDGVQTRGVVALLGMLADGAPPLSDEPDPALLAVFRSWRARLRLPLLRRVRGVMVSRRLPPPGP